VQLDRQVSCLLERLEAPEATGLERGEIALRLVGLGFFHAARRRIRGHKGEPVGARVRSFLKAIEDGEAILSAAAGALPLPVVEAGLVGNEIRLPGALLARHPGARRLVIVFAGNTTHLAIPNPLVGDKQTNLLCVRDPTHCFGLHGLPRIGRTYEECVRTFRTIAARLGVDEIYTIGASAGGYPALRFGFDLGARGVLGFSTPTSLDINDEPRCNRNKYPQLAPLYRKGRELGFDTVRLYREAEQRPSVLLVYCPDHPRDAMLTERMRGVKGVKLIRAPAEAGHMTFPWANRGGEMGGLLRRLFRLQPTLAADQPAPYPSLPSLPEVSEAA